MKVHQLLLHYRNSGILPKMFFKKLDSDITNFIWDYKFHRIQRAHLNKRKELGGLARPNFMYYNWAVNIKNMIHLLDNSAQQVDWIVMEREACSPCNIGATLLSPIYLNNKNYNKNPIIHSTIRTWKHIKQNLKLRNLSLLIPIVNNPSFKPSIIDKSFIQWERMGIKTLGDLYELGKLLSFQQLQLKYNLKYNQYFKYLQICDYLKKYTKDYHNMPTDLLDEAMKTKAEPANLIS